MGNRWIQIFSFKVSEPVLCPLQHLFLPSLPYLILSLCGLLVLASFPCSATLRPELDARAMGMGGAWTAQADGPSSVFWNPSGLAKVRTGSLFYDLSQGALAVALPIPYLGVVGASLLDLHGSDHFLIESPYNPIGTFETGYNQALISYARPIGHGILLGGNVSYSRAPYSDSRWQVGYDLGFSAPLGKTVRAGLRVADITGTRILDANGALLEEFSQQISAGITWNRFRWFKVNSDLDTARWRLRLGGEAGPPWLNIRLGVYADLDEPRSPFHWSTGFSFRYGRTTLNYAYVDLEERHHRLSLSWHWSKQEKRGYTEHEVNLTFPEPDTSGSSPSIRSSTQRAHEPRLPNPGATVQQPKRTSPGVQIQPPETLLRLDPVPEIKEDTSSTFSVNRGSLATQLANEYGVELEMVLAIIRAESSFDPMIVSSAGAVGLTQLMPDTARSLGLKVPTYRNVKKPTRNPSKDERFHPRKNLVAGLAYLRALLDTYKGNYALAISAYNAGPGRVDQQVPNIRETEKHVARVMNYFYQYKNSPERREVDLQRLDAVLTGSGR